MARVAQALNVTQPAISKQINELEEIVAQPVVTRDRNRLFLTLIGARLADHARAVLAQIVRAAFDIEAMASGVSGSVQVGAVSSVAPSLLPGAIALFKSSAPQSSVSITEGHFVSLYPLLDTAGLLSQARCFWKPEAVETKGSVDLFRRCLLQVARGKTIPFG